MTTLTNSWCDCCDSERADWQTEQRIKSGQFATTVYTQRLCLDCLRDKWAQVGKGDLWGMRYRDPVIGNRWNTKGDF